MSKQSKILTAAFFVAAVSLIFAAPAFAEDRAVLHGVLSDNAVVKRPIANPTVTVGGIAATIEGTS